MSHGRTLMASLLILLFVGLSFNAYACLLPVNGVTAAGMENGCSTPDEQPARQFCDNFTTIGVQSVGELHPTCDYQTICPEDTASLSVCANPSSRSFRLSDHPADGPPQDLLLKISVLRI